MALARRFAEPLGRQLFILAHAQAVGVQNTEAVLTARVAGVRQQLELLGGSHVVAFVGRVDGGVVIGSTHRGNVATRLDTSNSASIEASTDFIAQASEA